MTEPGEEAHAYQAQPNAGDQSATSKSRAAAERFGRARDWGGQRPQISLGAAALLAIGASIGTRTYLRRRAEARVRRLVWLAATARSLRTVAPPARTTAPIGGVGAVALLAAAIFARARRRQAHSRLEELSHRLAAVEARAAAHLPSERPRPRDVAIGALVGLGLAALVSRVLPRHSS